MNDFEQEISNWINVCDQALLESLPLHSILNSESLGDGRPPLRGLSTSCFRCTGSALVLAQNLKLWDAEILIRSVTEGTLKFVYILADPISFAQKVEEFSLVLPKIDSLRISDRADALMKVFSGIQNFDGSNLNGLLLSDIEVQKIRDEYPRPLRRQIEERWSFTQLVKELSISHLPYGRFFPALLHSYGLSSHIQHMDYTGNATSLNREYDVANGQNLKTHRSQYARLIADCYQLAFLRLDVCFRFLELDRSPLRAWVAKYDQFSSALSDVASQS